MQLKDRSKDIIISGGEKISSIEVEEALAAIATRAPKTQLAGPAPTLRGLSAVRQISPMTVTLA